jgi:prepilin-type N-terminal cleavage/methylation domain-containing protein
MRIPYLKYFINTCKSNRGFSLVELMVVMVIVGILATSVVFMFADPTAKVKAAAFDMRGHFNLARAEAVRRNDNILVQFIDSARETCSKETTAFYADCFAGGSFQGYVICFNENQGIDDDCSDEGGSAIELEEKIIKTVLFRDGVRYYKFGTDLPTPPSGPQSAPPIPSVAVVTLANNDGITFDEPPISLTKDFIYMNSNGTSEFRGSVIVYLPKDSTDLTTVRGKPFAVVVDNTSTGRVLLERWRPEMGASGTWFRR